MATFQKHTRGNNGGWFYTQEYTSPRTYVRCLNRVLDTYGNAMEDDQEGSVDWDRHWILVGRVAVSTNTQGQHFIHVFKSTLEGHMFLDEVIAPAYRKWADSDAPPEDDVTAKVTAKGGVS